MPSLNVFGTQPDLVGQALEAIVAESFVFSGQLVCDANAVFLKCAGQWHRLVLDAGTVHWKIQSHEPKPWSVPEEGWSYPHRAVGDDFGLVGIPVTDMSLHEDGASVEFTLTFADGRRLVVTNLHDSTSAKVEAHT
ncbi:MAG: hypothetical protein IPJ76_10305 [Flavobacteriales bacterium]|nr:MAG: hypothetical protein IPJ76_10305 [Flavobacteriales bacterium]